MSRASAGTVGIVLLIGLLWGLNWPAVKTMLTEIPPITIRATALTAAAAALAAVAFATGRRLRPPVSELPWMALTGLLSIFGFNVLVSFGQTMTESSRAAIIAYAMPAMTAGLSVALLGERLDRRRAGALGLGMAGLAALASEDWAGLVAAPQGAAIMLCAALSWAAGTVAMKAGRFTLAPVPLTAWFLGISAAASWPLALWFEAPWRLPAPSALVASVWLWHVLGPMVTCYLLWTGLVGRMPASLAALATLFAPVVGVSSSILLLGDPASLEKGVALALILGSIALTLSRPTTAGAR